MKTYQQVENALNEYYELNRFLMKNREVLPVLKNYDSYDILKMCANKWGVEDYLEGMLDYTLGLIASVLEIDKSFEEDYNEDLNEWYHEHNIK